MEDYEKHMQQDDIYLFNTGEAQQAYATFGCHFIEALKAHRFIVWAPNAQAVSVVGDFNNWDPEKNPMEKKETGVFIAFIEGLSDGDIYKYQIKGCDGQVRLKADPFAFHAEVRPRTASKVWDLSGYAWHDETWMREREGDIFKKPVSVYEVHMGSWRTKEGYNFPNMRETADELSEYVAEMGYTHVELLPLTEYPLDDSWGYQVTGFYAVTSRYGTPQDFMYFVDTMHRKGIGVILDWVPAHFPKDAHGLARFDGTCLYEHQNPMKANHPQWGTLIFNYGRPEVVSFLVSSAMLFLDVYHIDGLRVDAVTSMLYLDYARKKGEWIPNEHGGNIDLAAEAVLKKLNSVVLTRHPGAITVAEESTAYPMVTRPPYDGGLGFKFKWNMGFMHDTLAYMSMDPFFRQHHHNRITFSMHYAFSENFILPYSHDEVVHGKKSMLDKMFGDYDQKFSGLRALYGFMFAHPGKKLLFMGSDFGQFIEWDYKKELDWFLLKYPRHTEMQRFVRQLNHLYRERPSLYEQDGGWEGFTWLNVDEREKSALAFLRIAADGREYTVCAFNFTPVAQEKFTIGLPMPGILREVLNSDEGHYGGNGVKNEGAVESVEEGFIGLPNRAYLKLPPLAAVYFDYKPKEIEGVKNGQ
jgi:1,4-alpha-glucan branching enzyme